MTFQALKPYALLFFLAIAFLIGLMVQPMLRRESEFERLEGAEDAELVIRRMKGFEFIQPIMKVEPAFEAPELQPLKHALQEIIQLKKQEGAVQSVSLHLKAFDTGRWIAIAQDEQYHPASMLKLGLLITVLSEVEKKPDLLNKLLTLSPQDTAGQNNQFFSDRSIKVGIPYNIRELLESMTAHSDNNATRLLAKSFDPQTTSSVFKQLDLPEANFDRNQYTINVREASSFLNALFNGTIISPKYAEYAAGLLHKGAFQHGFVQAFPPNIRIWNKYGEWHDVHNNHELHETAIFYLGEQPYILTVMTRGNNPVQLKQTLQLLAKEAYQFLDTNHGNTQKNKKTSEPSLKAYPVALPSRVTHMVAPA